MKQRKKRYIRKVISDEILEEWQQDLAVFVSQITDGLSKEKTDQILSMAHLCGSLVKEVLQLRHKNRSQVTTRYNLVKQVMRLEDKINSLMETNYAENIKKHKTGV